MLHSMVKSGHSICIALTGFYIECNTGLKWVNGEKKNRGQWKIGLITNNILVNHNLVCAKIKLKLKNNIVGNGVFIVNFWHISHLVLVFLLLTFICHALRDLLPFGQTKKREKHPWRSVTFSKSKVRGYSLREKHPWRSVTFSKSKVGG